MIKLSQLVENKLAQLKLSQSTTIDILHFEKLVEEEQMLRSNDIEIESDYEYASYHYYQFLAKQVIYRLKKIENESIEKIFIGLQNLERQS